MPQTQVYPRWRGEHISSRTRASFRLGLSPLARGTHRPRTTIRANRRFIPAGAGNTTVQTAGYYFFAVYPRWRGEHLLLELVECCYSGLSPLARGTQRQVVAALRGRRFIPAGAGNTYIRAKNKATATVYPRWRGEHIYQNISFYSHGGLSPLARGTRIKHGLTRRAARFIPAGAGNTGSVCGSIAGGAGNTVDGEFFIAGAPVYPRWRGEHDRLRHLAVADQGLSPLARGTQNLLQNSL